MTRIVPRLLLAWCLLTPCAAAAHAEPPAPSSLEQVLAHDGYTPARLLQLAAAQLAQAQLGAAIASLERGLLLAPRDPQLQAALEHARAAAGLSEPRTSWLERTAHLLSLREWSWLAFAAIAGLSAAIILTALARPRRAGHITALITAGLVASMASAGVAITQADLQRACVLHDQTVLRRSPIPASEPVMQLHAGETVRMREAHGDFVYVETSEGSAGWLGRTQLAPLVAGPAT